VSLILEALKKLERDRQTHERGFLVLAPSAWSPRGERPRMRAAALAGAAALSGAAVAAFLLRPAPTAAPAAGTSGAASAAATGAVVPAVAPVTLAAARAAGAPLSVSRTAAGPSAPRVAVRWKGRQAAAPSAAAPAPLAAASAALEPAPTPITETAVTETAAPPAPEPDADAPVEDTAEAAPAPPAAAADQPLRLEAITERDGQPVAVVSGQVVRVGDQIGAATIVRIGVAEIEIETAGRRRIIRF
jgi:hypothetical protein